MHTQMSSEMVELWNPIAVESVQSACQGPFYFVGRPDTLQPTTPESHGQVLLIYHTTLEPSTMVSFKARCQTTILCCLSFVKSHPFSTILFRMRHEMNEIK
jgi:hypothetical protein